MELAEIEYLLRVNVLLHGEGLSMQQYLLMRSIRAHEVHTMTRIATKVGHSTAAATGMIDHLEDRMLVKRTHDREDRRRVLVSLTKKGISLIEKLEARFDSAAYQMEVELQA